MFHSTEKAIDCFKWSSLKIIPGHSVQQRSNHIDYSRTCSESNGCQERCMLCFWARTKDEHISLKNKTKQKISVLKHICLLFVFLCVFRQIPIFLMSFRGPLPACHHLRGEDTYSRFHMSGCCVEWNDAHAYRARVSCELADQTRICLWDRGKSAQPPKPPPNLSILINDPLIVAKCQLSLAPKTTQAHRCRRAHTQTQMLCGHPHQTTNSHLGIR